LKWLESGLSFAPGILWRPFGAASDARQLNPQQGEKTMGSIKKKRRKKMAKHKRKKQLKLQRHKNK
jgi:hypothetical protein